jgi:transposase
LPKRKVQDETNWAIVAYHKEKMVYQDIANKCGVSWNCVHHTIVRYEETGDIRESKSPDRPKSTSKRDDIKLLRLSKADPFKSLRMTGQPMVLQ